ncbi:MAG: sigma-54 dependent transcriptional regulator [Firmicutes bacterium]|nr:sigma-54 dependent transcriptional regulator [Bacillota bacterium]
MANRKILIVDDEQNVRMLLSRVLKKQGYEVLTAGDGAEGLDVMHHSNIDIIISDIRMPNMDGIEFLHKVREFDRSVGFILITAFATTETAIDALRSGAQDYVTKPFDIDELVSVVKKLEASLYSEESRDALDSMVVNPKIVSKSPKMQEVYELAKKVALADATVLITGESGTGKEVISTQIHEWSNRADKPMIKVNCGAIPDNLLESELFGYEKGAFTGAATSKPGRFEIADGGTLFLDEIGDISPALQVKLLRVLQEKTFERLGGVSSITVDVRVIAATNKNLKEEVEKGNFREDLYYRLNVVPIHIPPLRERKEDIKYLVDYFLRHSAAISGGIAPKKISTAAMERLINYSWPGNIRELENIIERCIVITSDDVIEASCLPSDIIYAGSSAAVDSAGAQSDNSSNTMLTDTIDSKEREVIIRVLEENGGNKTKSALALGISRRSLHRKIQKYGIDM